MIIEVKPQDAGSGSILSRFYFKSFISSLGPQTVRDHNQELGLYVGGIATYIPKQLYFYGSNIWRMHTLGIAETGGIITLSSNKTSSCG